MNRFVFAILFSLAGFVPSAYGVVLQPNETASKDVFVYEGMSNLNWDTASVGVLPYGKFLPVGKTDFPADGHDVESLLEFDLSSVTLTAAQVTSATLELYVIDNEDEEDGTGFGVNPTSTDPVTVNLFGIGPGAPPLWGETTVTWDSHVSLPLTSQYASTIVDGINQSFTFDVTALVKDWLDGTLANNGILLSADAPVLRLDVENFAVAAFSSSNGVVAPKLTIVPEPSSVVLALSACGTLALILRRRAARRRRLK